MGSGAPVGPIVSRPALFVSPDATVGEGATGDHPGDPDGFEPQAPLEAEIFLDSLYSSMTRVIRHDKEDHDADGMA
jgi:hypothetical protein